MKKILCLVLALTLLIVPLPVVASAQPISPLLFASCDMGINWVNGSYPATTHRIDYDNFTQGIGSVMYDGDLSKGTSWVAYTNFQDVADVSLYTHLEFDFYIDNIAVLDNAVGQIELTSSNACDLAELAFTEGQYKKQITQSGWNHVCLVLKNGVRNSHDPDRIFDPSFVNFFRFYLLGLESPTNTYTIGLDNIYFSDGVTKPEDTFQKSTYTPASPCKNNGYLYGDVNADQQVNSKDALLCLQAAVEKTNLKNLGFAMGDVNGSGNVDAADALEILRVTVQKQTAFSVETKETLPERVEVGINGSHLVHTQYPTDTRVVAVTDVIYWGAMGDGVTDDTNAFRAALAYAESVGGGTVFVPSGKYRINRFLIIPNGVTLQGDSPAVSVEDKVEGTVLLAYNGRGTTDDFPFLNMDSASAVANLSIYYPEQTMEQITPYPFTIKQIGHYGIAVTNVRLVNSYQGICMGPNTNSLQNIRGVVGTPLKMGLILDCNVDICRIEQVNFSKECWLNSGLGESVNEQALADYLYENATAFQFERVDWTYITDIAVNGYHTAFKTCKPTMREAEESANGHVYGVDFRNCYMGIDADFVNVIGMMITNGTIHAEVPLKTSKEFYAELSLNRIELKTTQDTAVVLEGGGVVSLENCTLIAQKRGVDLQGGSLICNRVTFEQVGTRVFAQKGTTASLINCESNLPFDMENYWGNVTVTNDEKWETAQFEPEKYDYNQQAVTRPAGDGFVDLTKAPYHADTTCTYDVGQVLQQALDQVAEQGGGVVYLPSGRYRLDSPITIPTGVELRGSATFPQHSHAYATTFYTGYGKGGDQATRALITLSPASGVTGFKVYYDSQAGGVNDCDPYAFSLRGQGSNNYVMNVEFVNSFYQMDLATNRCDSHYVNGVTGYPLEQGIVVGGGSTHGVVRDCQFNIHYFGDNPIYQTSPPADDYFEYGMNNSEAFVVGNTTHQIMYQNFVLGVHSGIAIDSGADVFVLAHGTDVGDRSITLRGTPSGEVVFVNTQLVAYQPGATRAYINIEPSFTGRVDMTQTNFWGDPGECSVLVGGGTLYLSQGNNIRSGTLGVKVWNNANLVYHTINHLRTDVSYDLYLKDAGKVVTYGNLYASGGTLFDTTNAYQGNEFQ